MSIFFLVQKVTGVIVFCFYGSFIFKRERGYNKAKPANTTARASLQSNANGFDLGFDLARKASRATHGLTRTP